VRWVIEYAMFSVLLKAEEEETLEERKTRSRLLQTSGGTDVLCKCWILGSALCVGSTILLLEQLCTRQKPALLQNRL